jgi:uncharacterized phage infection (PIP) family protein YhgE
MNSTPDFKANDADDALAARADERLVHAYKQIADADEQLVRLTEHLSKMAHDDVPRAKPSRSGSTLRGLLGLLLGACIIVAAFVSQSSSGDAAKEVISRWAPPLVSPQWLAPERSGPPGQPSSLGVQLATAEMAPSQAVAPARTTAQDAAPAPLDVTPLLHEMLRVLAVLQQGVEQLKAGQEQMASDNAKVVEQLKASQEQMARLTTKSSEPRTSDQSLAPKTSAPQASAPKTSAAKTSAPLPHPSPSPTRKPVATRSSPQAQAQPRTPVQSTPEDQ